MVLPASTWAKAIGSQAHPGAPTRSAAQITFDSIPAEGHLLQDILPGHKLLAPLQEYGIVDTADIAYEFGITADYMDRQGQPSAAVARAAKLMPPTSSVELARFLQEVQRRLSVEKSLPPPSSMYSLSHHTQTLLKGILPPSTASPRRELKPLPPPPLPSAHSQEQAVATSLASRASTPSERSRNDTSVTAPSSPAEPSQVAVGTEPVAPLPLLPPAAPMLSGLNALDDCFPDDLGLPPGRALEIIGPTASGKSRLGLQLVVESRLAGLRMGRQTNGGGDSEDERDGPGQEGSRGRKNFDEVLIIDTEGSLTPDIISETVWQRVKLLKLTDLEATGLFDEVLEGIHLTRPASLPELIAILRVLTAVPSVSRAEQQQQAGAGEGEGERTDSLPALRSLSAILLDSLSFHLRTPLETTPERRARRHALSLLSSLLPSLAAQNPRVRLVATGQMSLKMFSRAGDLVTYRTPGSIARMVPQVEAPGGPGGVGAGGAGGGGGAGEYTLKAWTGEGSTGSSGVEKGPGVLGEGAWRVLLFRLGERRMAQLFYSPPPPPPPHPPQPHHTKKREDEEADEEKERGKGSATHPASQGAHAKLNRQRIRPLHVHEEGRWIPFRIDTHGQVVMEKEGEM